MTNKQGTLCGVGLERGHVCRNAMIERKERTQRLSVGALKESAPKGYIERKRERERERKREKERERERESEKEGKREIEKEI
jgi:hypothetical protein